MSAPATPPLPPARRIVYSGGQIAMLVIGGILLLPGLCSIVFAIGMVKDISFTDPITHIAMVVWGTCLAISLVGVILIALAWRGARARQ